MHVDIYRKKEMQDLKRMQREEARQQQELNSRHDQLREQQERKFAFEKQVIIYICFGNFTEWHRFYQLYFV